MEINEIYDDIMDEIVLFRYDDFMDQMIVFVCNDKQEKIEDVNDFFFIFLEDES